MSREVQRRDEEIRAWNTELQQRVEARGAELRAAQDQILRARRLAAIGSLGAGIAHEINNPLMAISGLAALLRRKAHDPEQADSLAKLQEQVTRVARIVEDLRQFTSQERSAAGRRFQLEEPVRTVLGRYAPELSKKGIALNVDVQQGLRETEGDPIQIEQVIEHLVKNAMQAMPEGGELRVAVADVAGDSVKLTVADTGCGISPALRERIFDPFFTTKEKAKSGVGLGLSISHTIVEAHHGRILVDSAEGRGATFTVLLPAAAQAAHLS
jgi:signal transduction histidine kinase